MSSGFGTEDTAGPGPQEPAWGSMQSGAPMAPAALTPAVDESLVRRAWAWTAATVLLLPILMFWSLPNAALVSDRLRRGDVAGAQSAAGTCKKLGIAAVAVFVVVLVVYVVVIAAAVGSAVDSVNGM